jgi:hypothetical protein
MYNLVHSTLARQYRQDTEKIHHILIGKALQGIPKSKRHKTNSASLWGRKIDAMMEKWQHANFPQCKCPDDSSPSVRRTELRGFLGESLKQPMYMDGVQPNRPGNH